MFSGLNDAASSIGSAVSTGVDALGTTHNIGSLGSTTGWDIAKTGLGIGGSILNYYGQRQAAQENNENQAKAWAANRNLLAQQAHQAQAANAVQKSKVAMDAMAMRARLQAAAGQAGIAGNSVDRANAVANTQANQSLSNLDMNAQMQQEEIFRRGDAARSQARANMQTGPSLGNLGLQIGGDLLGFGSTLAKRGTTLK